MKHSAIQYYYNGMCYNIVWLYSHKDTCATVTALGKKYDKNSHYHEEQKTYQIANHQTMPEIEERLNLWDWACSVYYSIIYCIAGNFEGENHHEFRSLRATRVRFSIEFGHVHTYLFVLLLFSKDFSSKGSCSTDLWKFSPSNVSHKKPSMWNSLSLWRMGMLRCRCTMPA